MLALQVAKSIVEEVAFGCKIEEEIYIVNTKIGLTRYNSLVGNVPKIDAEYWKDEYGILETSKGHHFIFLNEDLVKTKRYGDIIATLIDEILHAVYPNRSEKEIIEIENHCCYMKAIKREWSLSHSPRREKPRVDR